MKCPWSNIGCNVIVDIDRFTDIQIGFFRNQHHRSVIRNYRIYGSDGRSRIATAHGNCFHADVMLSPIVVLKYLRKI